ncbi:MAG: molybdate ABC transporter substrate-binding protein [Clostridiales bacterium]|nr:molybdate ABC transporter substrate-binding protein [Clostridiales bacterium]
MKKRIVSIILAAMLGSAMLAGCGSSSTDSTDDAADDVSVSAEAETEEADADEELSAEEEEEAVVDQFEETTITIYAAASLQTVLTELIDVYNETQPNVTIVGSYDSSGTLLTQIEEANGDGIDIFFSAAQKQMNTLEEDDGLVVDGTRHNVVNNQVCVITYTGSETTVTGLADIANASSLALADGSVPVGKYTRQALVNAGMLDEVEDVSTITTDEVSAALGGIEINECGNVSKVLQAVAEQSNEVGTVYYSDTYGYEDQVEILEYVSYDLTGNVIYPVAQVANGSADELESAAAADFIEFLISDEAKAVFDSYYFDTDVED